MSMFAGDGAGGMACGSGSCSSANIVLGALNQLGAVADQLGGSRAPWDCGSTPGMANTSRPCSPARRAVTSEPLCLAASTTSVPRLRPLMMRLRRGVLPARRPWSGGNSETSAPLAAILSASARCREGIDARPGRAADSDGLSAARERAFVAGAVDAFGQPAGDREAAAREKLRRTARARVASAGRGVAAAHDRELRSSTALQAIRSHTRRGERRRNGPAVAGYKGEFSGIR